MAQRTRIAPDSPVVVGTAGDPEGSLEGLVVDQRYAVEAEVGRGAMGIVYRARHVDLGRPVAIKVLHRSLLRTPTMIERFEREAQLAARLHHPNVVPVLDVGELSDGRRSMILELATGDELGHLLRGPWPATRALAILKQLCDGLEHAHRLGLVHRDLKPENILVEHGEDGTEVARIIDFGLAIVDDDSSMARLTEAGRVVGTPAYMAPEQATGGRIDHRADLYALGVIAFEMLAGERPFVGTNAEIAYAHVTTAPPTIASRLGRPVDPLLESIVATLLAKAPGDRLARAHVVRQLFDLVERDRPRAAALLGVTLDASDPVVADQPEAIPDWVTAASTTPLAAAWSAYDTTATASLLPVPAPVSAKKSRTRPWLWALGALAIVIELALFALVPDEPTREVRPARTRAATSTEPARPRTVDRSERIEPPAPPPPVARPPVIAAPPPPATDTTKPRPRPAVAPAPPVVEAAPEPSPAPIPEPEPPAISADQLVARYAEVGRLVRAAVAGDPLGADAQQIHYRAIAIHEALVSPASRLRTFETLDRIARDLAAP